MGQGSRYEGIERREGKKGVRWVARLELGIDPLTGKRRQREQAFGTEQEARRARAVWVAEREHGTVVTISRITVREILLAWLDRHMQGKAPLTIVSYQATVHKHLLPSSLSRLPVQRLTAGQVQAYYNQLIAQGTGQRTRELVHLRLCQALDMAVELGHVGQNVARRCAVNMAQSTVGRALSQEQVAAFLAVAAHDTYHPIWHLALATGLRRGELLGLRWSDIDFGLGLLHVRQTLVWYDRRPHLQERTKSAAGRRMVQLDPTTMRLLLLRQGEQEATRHAAGSRWNDLDLVFSVANGGPIGPNNLHRSFKQLLMQAGLPNIRLHDLRHTHITHLVGHGVPLPMVAERGGYADPSTLLDVYSHILPSMQELAVEAAARLTSWASAEEDGAGGQMVGKKQKPARGRAGFQRAGDRARTDDILLGKQTLCQLSYTRIALARGVSPNLMRKYYHARQFAAILFPPLGR
ncbi:MAG: integration/recombination/inversion protein [Chloroflexi bacterium]|nr:integration/recombination/inversion protein [Chloroflexota bacterium]